MRKHQVFAVTGPVMYTKCLVDSKMPISLAPQEWLYPAAWSKRQRSGSGLKRGTRARESFFSGKPKSDFLGVCPFFGG